MVLVAVFFLGGGQVWDEDTVGSLDLSKHQFIGSCTLTLAELMTAREMNLSKPLAKAAGGPTSTVTIKVRAPAA